MNVRTFVITIASLSLLSCSGKNLLKTVSSNVLANTGIVSHSQADNLFDAGDKLVDAASTFSDEEEYYLGRAVAAEILTKYRPVKNQRLVRYVNLVGKTVANASARPETFGGYHFEVLASNEVNAFAAPGGFIFITEGLLKLAKDEDALATILAHEVAHIVNNDGINAISNANLTEAATLLGTTAASRFGGNQVASASNIFGSSVRNIADSLLKNGYSRSQEYAADELATEIVTRAGYNPYSLVQMMDALQMASENSEGGWFETHPDAADRKEELEDVVDSDYAEASEDQLLRAKRFRKYVA